MAAEQRGKALARKNSERAAQMKRDGVERTTGRCPNCYKIVTCDSRISTNKHVGRCWH